MSEQHGRVVTVEEMEARLAQLRGETGGEYEFACDLPILGRLARDSSEIRIDDWREGTWDPPVRSSNDFTISLWDETQGDDVVWGSYEGWADGPSGSFAIRWLGRLMQERENGGGPYRTPPAVTRQLDPNGPGDALTGVGMESDDAFRARILKARASDGTPVAIVPRTPEYDTLLDELRGTTGEDDWVQTFSGHQVWVHHPRPQDVAITDIAQHLGKLCRFHGGVREYYSVSQHSVLVSQNVPDELALAALLHDAHEAYLNDLARPVKRFMPLYKELCRRHDKVISQVFFGHPDAFEHPEIKHADNVVLATEKRDLMRGEPASWGPMETPLREVIVPLGPDASSRLFIARWIEVRHQGVQR